MSVYFYFTFLYHFSFLRYKLSINIFQKLFTLLKSHEQFLFVDTLSFYIIYRCKREKRCISFNLSNIVIYYYFQFTYHIDKERS